MTNLRASDGLLARAAGAWTKDKLYHVERYAQAFMKSMAPKRRSGAWSELLYVDLLAGPGRCIIRDTPEEIDGSPLRALRVTPAFDTLFLSDASRANVDALRRRIPSEQLPRVRFDVGDCNVVVRDVMKRLSGSSLALAFLDPEGFEVHFETLALLASRRVDIIYLFPSGIGIKWNVRQFLRRSSEKMDLFWGGSEWRTLTVSHHSAATPLSDEDARVAMTWVEAFRQKAARIGLESDQSPPLISNDRNAAMYHLLFFSKSDVALKIWKNTTRIDPRGQRSLSLS